MSKQLTILSKQSGFTLVEIIVVIAIMGIIGGLSSLIIGRSLDSYAALERRTDLQTSIRLGIERISREVRHALPRSICVNAGAGCVNSGNQFYFVPVRDSGRYQDRPGAYVGGPPILRERLPVSPRTSNLFDILSSNAANRLNAQTDDWVAVYNINNTDIYAGTNNVRQQINVIVQKDIHNDGDTATDIDQIQFSGNQTFSNHSPTRRFHIVDNNNQATLFTFNVVTGIISRDTTTFTAPNTITVNSRILMQNVQACTFTYTPGSPQRSGLLRIDITVSQQGEIVQVIQDAHIYNTP